MKRIIMFMMLAFMPVLVSQAANYNVGPVEGRLKNVYGNSITISVVSDQDRAPDANLKNTGDLSFKVDSATAYKNVASLSNLKEGDRISIEYTEDRNGNMATLVSKLETTVVATDVTTVDVPAATTTTTTTVTTTPQTTTTTYP